MVYTILWHTRKDLNPHDGSWKPGDYHYLTGIMVVLLGVEPRTYPLSGDCYYQLSYSTILQLMVGTVGIAPNIYGFSDRCMNYHCYIPINLLTFLLFYSFFQHIKKPPGNRFPGGFSLRSMHKRMQSRPPGGNNKPIAENIYVGKIKDVGDVVHNFLSFVCMIYLYFFCKFVNIFRILFKHISNAFWVWLNVINKR